MMHSILSDFESLTLKVFREITAAFLVFCET